MNTRSLKIALAASVALNLFALAAGATLLVGRADVERRLEAQHRAPRDRPFMAVVEGLDPAVRERVRETLRASARDCSSRAAARAGSKSAERARAVA